LSFRQFVLNHLWDGKDPFSAFPRNTYAVDHQGWNSDHASLVEAVDRHRPQLIVEIGVWKGGSAITMARRLKELQLDAVLIAVDTWLGAADHWMNRGFFNDLGMENGYPRLFHRFMANVLDQGLEDYIVPMPIDSTNAAVVLRSVGWRPDIIHVDAGHDYDSVTKDLSMWWPMLNAGGTLIADDYWHADAWPDVKRGVDDYFRANPPAEFAPNPPKCVIRKAA
jgi:hypothetical protein